MIRICLAGITGKVGQHLAQAIIASTDLKLVSATSKNSAGQTIKEALQHIQSDVMISSTIEDALKNNNVDVVIDFTTPAIVKKNVMIALKSHVNVVIGTSGLSDDDYNEIENLALQNQLGVVAAGNFSLTAALLQYMAKLAAQLIPSWEIIDYAPATKVDSPSGTTKELAYILKQFSKSTPMESSHNLAGSRGAFLNNSHIHSIRIPGYFSSTEIQFGLNGERLSLRHDSIESTPYVEGTLLAARKVSSVKGLSRGLDQLMQFNNLFNHA